MNILVLSAGRRVSLIRGFKEALETQTGSVFAADMCPEMSAACHVADMFFQVPHCQSSEFIEELIRLCQKNKISLIIPTIDTELFILSSARERFSEIGVEVLVSDQEIIKICRDKRLTAEFFESIDLNTPKVYKKDEMQFPVLVKPYDGSLSAGVILVSKPSELTQDIMDNKKNMFCQYIDPTVHDEFTVDMYFDRSGVLQCVVPRKRMEVRGGEVSKAITIKNKIIEKFFECFESVEGIRGCINLQLFMHQKTEDFWCIEINPRFGGGYPLTRLAGATFEQWIVDEYFNGKQISKCSNWKKNLIMLRYDDEVLVDGN